MVFYIEACESGSMMNHLPDNINGEQSVNLLDLNVTACQGTIMHSCSREAQEL